jgi:hypothetical protein
MNYKIRSKFCNEYCLSLILLVLLVVIWQESDQLAYSSLSPSFGRQELIDSSSDWIDMLKGDTVSNIEPTGPQFTDIQSVNYLSNGEFLNVTLWLSSILGLDSLNESSATRQIYYGILFDSDANNNTGFQGIDYQVEIKWNDTSKDWKFIYNEFSANGKTRNITTVVENLNNFYDRKSDSLWINTDLQYMGFPERYKAFVYSYSLDNGRYLLDAARWIVIPPEGYKLSTIPEVISITKGEDKVADILINSTSGTVLSFNIDG